MRIIASLLIAAFALRADTLRLKSGAVVEGTFLGGTAREIQFLAEKGGAKTYSLNNVATIQISGPPPQPAPAPPASRGVLVPANTVVTVRLIDGIDVDSAATGQKFRASIDDPIMVGGNVIVPRGANAEVQAVAVQQSGKLKGSDQITLKLARLTANGRLYDVVSNYAEQKSAGEGKKTTRKVLGGAGLGAIIGGIAGGGSGAAIGAVAGGGTGAVVSAAGQAHLKLPAETRVQFKLAADLRIK